MNDASHERVDPAPHSLSILGHARMNHCRALGRAPLGASDRWVEKQASAEPTVQNPNGCATDALKKAKV